MIDFTPEQEQELAVVCGNCVQFLTGRAFLGAHETVLERGLVAALRDVSHRTAPAATLPRITRQLARYDQHNLLSSSEQVVFQRLMLAMNPGDSDEVRAELMMIEGTLR